MKVIIDYLNNRLNDLENQRNEKETLMNSKIIEANEIHKTISKLNFYDNDTYNVFNASGSRMEFQNREIIELKAQEDLLRTEADDISDEIKNINSMIEEIAIVIAHANSNNTKLNSLSNDVIRLNGELAMYTTGGKKTKKSEINDVEVKEEKTTETDEEEKQLLSSNIETLDINTDNKKFLEEIADRLYFVSRILKFDPVRVKLELDEIYKGIIKYINK
ncbi:MAG: hypothetical protein PUF12_05325 [Thermoflexaceae bacterium]|nr:hypothetical protein [Thermoflexaceae bacterium]